MSNEAHETKENGRTLVNPIQTTSESDGTSGTQPTLAQPSDINAQQSPSYDHSSPAPVNTAPNANNPFTQGTGIHGSPWSPPGQFASQNAMGAGSPIPQAYQPGFTSPMMLGAPYAAYGHGSHMAPGWVAPSGLQPQPGQQLPPGGAPFNPFQGQMGQFGVPPWAGASSPPSSPTSTGSPGLPMSTHSQLPDPSQAQQAAMFQQYMQAAQWQLGPNGTPVPMWPPPPWMYSMYSGFPTSPPMAPVSSTPASPIQAPSVPESIKSTAGPTGSSSAGPSAPLPPYTEANPGHESHGSSNAAPHEPGSSSDGSKHTFSSILISISLIPYISHFRYVLNVDVGHIYIIPDQTLTPIC